jgi:hypothetical protein
MSNLHREQIFGTIQKQRQKRTGRYIEVLKQQYDTRKALAVFQTPGDSTCVLKELERVIKSGGNQTQWRQPGGAT